MLKFYNTLTRKVENFTPLYPPNVSYYSCGPTVYDFAHIGHARTYIFADILERVLKFNGFKVKRVMNITDVGHLTSDSDTGEDKMEKEALQEKKSVWEIAKFYTDDFWRMCQKLNIVKPEIICNATNFIPQMINLINLLEKKGYTYNISDGIYFDTAKFPNYGELTGQSFDNLQKGLKAGARVEMVKGKKNPTDFALWKLTPSGVIRQMEWDSPWGKGFPGWHIECSTMCMENLGETVDIHTGGVDHIPIHHTNEIAQSEAATGRKFVSFWLHSEHLLVEGKKMSKSLGNFYRLTDIIKRGFIPLSLRYLFLTASYRQQMNFTWASLSSSQNAYNSLKAQVSDLKNSSDISSRSNLSEEKLTKINNFRDKFTKAVNDDLNTAQALGVVWEVLKSSILPEDKYDLILLFDDVLGLDLTKSIRQLTDKNQKSKIPLEILDYVKKREELRKEKKWEEADEMRKIIEEKGYYVKDTSTGPAIKRKMH